MGGWRPRALACALIVVTGCGGDSERRCEVAPVAGTPFDLVPGGAATQIHADLAFDGSQLWLAYNLPDSDGSGGFDSFTRRLGCDGSFVGEPIALTTTAGGNDVDPSIAVSGDTVAAAWSTDTGAATNNLDLLYRAVDLDGLPLTDSDVVIETSRGGDPAPGNVLFPKLAALPDGGFAVAAVRGLDETGTFQVFTQRLADDGALVGEAIDPMVEAGVTHTGPSLAATADGDLHLAWTRSPAQDESYAVRARLPAGAASFDPPTQLDDMASGATVAIADDGALLLAYADTASNLVLTAGDSRVGFGAEGRIDHAPRIAVGPGGGVVGYYRNISGLQNEYVVQPFSWDGAALSLGAETVLAIDPVAPYPPALVHVEDGVYFAAWSQGTSPDFYLSGMFVAP